MNLTAENTLNLIRTRQSVRKYSTETVSRESLDRCIEAARLAPSANNGQPWSLVAIEEPETRSRLAKAARFGLLAQNPFAAEAPVIVAVIETPGHRPTSAGGRLLRQNFPLMDIGMAVQNFCLQATAEGLGTCIIGLFVAREVRKALKIPPGHRIRLLITMGTPVDSTVRMKKRHPKDQMCRYI